MRGLIWSLLLGVEQEAKKNVGVYEVKINICLVISVKVYVQVYVEKSFVYRCLGVSVIVEVYVQPIRTNTPTMHLVL